MCFNEFDFAQCEFTTAFTMIDAAALVSHQHYKADLVLISFWSELLYAESCDSC